MKVYTNEKLNIIEEEFKNAKLISFEDIPERMKKEIEEETAIKIINNAYKTPNGHIVEFESKFFDDLYGGEVYMSDKSDLIIWNIASII